LKRLSVVDVMGLVVEGAVDAVVEMARVAEAMDLSAVAVVMDLEQVDVVVVMAPIEVLLEAVPEAVDPALQSIRMIPMLSQALVHKILQGSSTCPFDYLARSVALLASTRKVETEAEIFLFIRRRDSRLESVGCSTSSAKSNHAGQSYGWGIHDQNQSPQVFITSYTT
jgi:hypothetical protein